MREASRYPEPASQTKMLTDVGASIPGGDFDLVRISKVLDGQRRAIGTFWTRLSSLPSLASLYSPLWQVVQLRPTLTV